VKPFGVQECEAFVSSRFCVSIIVWKKRYVRCETEKMTACRIASEITVPSFAANPRDDAASELLAGFVDRDPEL